MIGLQYAAGLVVGPIIYRSQVLRYFTPGYGPLSDDREEANVFFIHLFISYYYRTPSMLLVISKHFVTMSNYNLPKIPRLNPKVCIGYVAGGYGPVCIEIRLINFVLDQSSPTPTFASNRSCPAVTGGILEKSKAIQSRNSA